MDITIASNNDVVIRLSKDEAKQLDDDIDHVLTKLDLPAFKHPPLARLEAFISKLSVVK
jgi:hypothetical protein